MTANCRWFGFDAGIMHSAESLLVWVFMIWVFGALLYWLLSGCLLQVPEAFQNLISQVDETLKHALEEEEKVPLSDVINFDEVLFLFCAAWCCRVIPTLQDILHCHFHMSVVTCCTTCSASTYSLYTGLIFCNFYSAPVGVQSIVINLSVREHISGTAWPISTKFCLQIPCGHGSVLIWRRCAMLCTSGFMVDVTFGCSGLYEHSWA